MRRLPSLALMESADRFSHLIPGAGDRRSDRHGDVGAANDNTYTYTYTNAHQVATDAASIAAWKWLPTSCTTPPCTDAYAAANTLNQYPNVTLSGQSAQTLSYDTRGNLTGDGVWTYTYDAENRMLTANRTGPIVNATFAYDPMGRRVKKSTGGGGATTYYVSDGADEIAEYTGFTANTLQRRYVPGPAIDQPIAMVTAAGAKTYFHTDKRGSVIAMSDSSGNINEGPTTYDAYGNASSTTGVPFKFTGRRLDAELGLYYYRARMYSPALGRFPQTDPVGYSAGMNLYASFDNDPTDKSDPTGKIILILGDDKFKQKVQSDIEQVRKAPEGEKVYDQLQNSKNVHLVAQSPDKQFHSAPASRKDKDGGPVLSVDMNTPNASNGVGSDSVVFYAASPDNHTQGPRDETGSRDEPTFVALAHELGHAQDIDRGNYIGGRAGLSPQTTGTTPPVEKNAVQFENAIRNYFHIPLRPSYYYPGWREDAKSDGR